MAVLGAWCLSCLCLSFGLFLRKVMCKALKVYAPYWVEADLESSCGRLHERAQRDVS